MEACLALKGKEKKKKKEEEK